MPTATRILPVQALQQTAVWANIHGKSSYDFDTKELTVSIVLFDENENTIYPIQKTVLPQSVTDEWGSDDSVVFLAALQQLNLVPDTEYVPPAPPEPIEPEIPTQTPTEENP